MTDQFESKILHDESNPSKLGKHNLDAGDGRTGMPEKFSADSKIAKKFATDQLSKWKQFFTIRANNHLNFLNGLLSRADSFVPRMPAFLKAGTKSLFSLRLFLLGLVHRSSSMVSAYDFFSGRIIINRAHKLWVAFLSETLTISLGALAVLVSLAQSAILETQKSNWQVSDNLSVTFLDRNGRILGNRGDLARKYLTDEIIPNHLVDATLVTLDKGFMEHLGFDSIESMIPGSASPQDLSITQEVVQELFSSNRRPDYAFFTEFFLLLWLEVSHSKLEILNHFFDRAYFGSGIFGIVDAAEYYFNKKVDSLTLAESALLVGILDSDGNYEPEFNLPFARQKAGEVLNRMLKNKLISPDQFNKAKSHPANIAHHVNSSYVPDYFLDMAYREVKRQTKDSTESTFIVRTTLDLDLQSMASSTVWQSIVEAGQRSNTVQLSMVSMEPDGAVTVMIGSTEYGLNRTNPLTETLHHPGSSIKPLLLSSTIDVPSLQRVNNGIRVDEYTLWLTKDRSQANSRLDSNNWDSVETLDTAIVATNTGIEIEQLQSSLLGLGVSTERSTTEDYHNIAAKASVVDMASGYAALSNGGHRVLPYAVLEIYKPSNEIVWSRTEHEMEKLAIVKPETAYLVNQTLVENVQRSFKRNRELYDYTLAGKFGYSTQSNSSWYIGYSGSLTTAIWCGCVSKSENELEGDHEFIATIWNDFMSQALPSVPPRKLPGTEPTFYEMENDSESVSGKWKTPPSIDGSLTGLSPNLLDFLQQINRKMFEIQYGTYN